MGLGPAAMDPSFGYTHGDMCLRKAVLFAATVCPAFAADWNPRAAADYLDSRQQQWSAWPVANRSGVPCVSCHTGAPYLFARPALRRALGEKAPTVYETALRESLRARVNKNDLKELFPQGLKEPHASEALGVEAIFSALFLDAGDDGRRRALDRLWSLQLRTGENAGAWSWNTYDLDPFEMPDSTFYGAALAALAVGDTPLEYRNSPDVRPRIAALTGYLQRKVSSQPLHNRLLALWAASTLPEVLPASLRSAVIETVWKKQEPDGGWALESLGPWKQRPRAPQPGGSSAYATALTSVVMKKAGVKPSDPRLTRALDWLRSHQDRQGGYWAADSMNKQYEPDSMPLLFMRDVATAYAALALLTE